MGSHERLWYGRNRTVSRQVVGLAIGLSALVTGIFYTDVNTLWPAPLETSGGALLVGLTSIEAYYNEGLLVAWLLAFATSLPAFVFYPPRGPVFAVSPATAPAAIATAAATAVALGTVGFAIGSSVRRRRDGQRGVRYEPSSAFLPRLFVGRDSRATARWLAAAAGESAVLFAAVRLGVLPFGFDRGGVGGGGALLAVMAGPALLSAYRNDGVFVSWALAVAPLFGVLLAIQVGGTAAPAPDRPVLFALGTSSLLGIPVGTISYLLGRALRWLGQRRRSPETSLLAGVWMFGPESAAEEPEPDGDDERERHGEVVDPSRLAGAGESECHGTDGHDRG